MKNYNLERAKYIDHAQSKSSRSVPNENNKSPKVKKLMEDWGVNMAKIQI